MENNIASLERDLVSIMGVQNYAEIMGFYKHVFEIDCTKVIAEGRTYALYKIFESIFEVGGRAKRGGKVYTTHAISQIPKGQEKVLVVTDVIEDANPILNYINKLSNLNVVELDNISVWCIACSSKLDIKNLKPYFKHVKYLLLYEIRQLAICLSKAIMRVDVGYLSFVNSYRFKKLTFEDISRVKYRQFIENDLQSFSDCKIISKILWRDFFSKDVISTYRIKPCIRFYERQGEVIAIPYVFLPQLNTYKVCEYCKDLLSFFGLNYPECFENDRELLYKWTVYSVSKLIFEIFIDESKDETEKWDYGIIDFSEELFGINENTKLVKPEAYTYDGSQIAKSELAAACSDNELLCECLTYKKSLPDAINLYLYLMKVNNAKRKGDILYHGLMSCDVLSIGKEFLFSQDEVLSEVIRCLDCEKLILSFEENKDNTIFDAFLYAGKHSQVGYYKELHKKAYAVHHAFYRRTREPRPDRHLKLAMFLDEKLGTNEFSGFAIHLDEVSNLCADFESIKPELEVNSFVKSYITTFVEHYYNP